MEISVKSKYLKISARKLRPVVNLVRGKTATWAITNLKFIPNKGAKFVSDLILNAVSIAKSEELGVDKLVVFMISCSDGSRLKRGVPSSKGSMMPISKRTSHLYLTLKDDEIKKEKSS